MATSSAQAAIDQLYAAPLASFVGERTRLARELKAAGEQAAAEQLAVLPKPSAAAWALNHVVRNDAGAEAVQDWLAATEQLRHATSHLGKARGDALRSAMAGHRAATEALLDVTRERARPNERPLSAAMLDRVRALLQAATADEQISELLRVGRLTEGATPDALAPEPVGRRPATKPRTTTKRGPSPKGDRPAAARAASDGTKEATARRAHLADLRRKVTHAEASARRRQGELTKRRAAVTKADERAADARRALDRAESAAATAHDALETAERGVAAADRELAETQALLSNFDD